MYTSKSILKYGQPGSSWQRTALLRVLSQNQNLTYRDIIIIASVLKAEVIAVVDWIRDYALKTQSRITLHFTCRKCGEVNRFNSEDFKVEYVKITERVPSNPEP